MKPIPSWRNTSNPRYPRNNAIKPNKTREDKPPIVTTDLKTLSDLRGSVEISRGVGVAKVDNLFTQTFLLRGSIHVVKQIQHDLHNARSSDLAMLNRSQFRRREAIVVR